MCICHLTVGEKKKKKAMISPFGEQCKKAWIADGITVHMDALPGLYSGVVTL